MNHLNKGMTKSCQGVQLCNKQTLPFHFFLVSMTPPTLSMAGQQVDAETPADQRAYPLFTG